MKSYSNYFNWQILVKCIVLGVELFGNLVKKKNGLNILQRVSFLLD